LIDFKEEIANSISKAIKIEKEEIIGYIEMPENTKFGDYAFPCFRLAKTLKKAPAIIASELKEKLELDETKIEKTEIVSGYLNFFINKKALIKTVLEEIAIKKENYGRQEKRQK